MYSAWDIAVREVGGGIWFFMSLFMSLAFAIYAFREYNRAGLNPVTLVAVSFEIFCFGSAMRGFLTWMQFMAAGNGSDPSRWIETWPWLGLSVLLNILGAAWCIWLISPHRWRVCTTIVSVAVAIGVPVTIFALA
jgi:hypothetical protein